MDSCDLILVGADAGELTPTGFNYNTDTWTGTWTWTFPTLAADKFLLALSDAVTSRDSGLPLAGEHTDGGGQSVSGDSVPGGDFQFRFDVLPGDATNSSNQNCCGATNCSLPAGSWDGSSTGCPRVSKPASSTIVVGSSQIGRGSEPGR